MLMDRRKFLRAALFVAAAPVIVKASSLMPIRAERYTWVPMIKPLEYTEPSLYLRALIESMEQAKEMVAAQFFVPSRYLSMSSEGRYQLT